MRALVPDFSVPVRSVSVPDPEMLDPVRFCIQPDPGSQDPDRILRCWIWRDSYHTSL